MSEGLTIREALDELCHVCAENPRVGRIPEHVAALEARLAEAERALREIADFGDHESEAVARAALPSESERSAKP